MILDSYIDSMYQLSEISLRRMYRTDILRFCYREVWENGNRSRLDGTSFRYTAIAVIGLLAANQQQKLSHWKDSEITAIQHDLFKNRFDSKDLGDWGLLLWMLSNGCYDLSQTVYKELGARLSGNHVQMELSRWGAMELSFLLIGIVAHIERDEFGNKSRKLADIIFNALASTFYVRSGLFFGIPRKSDWTKAIRRSINSFASQIYPIYALTRYHCLFGSADALLMAETCASKLIECQTSTGGWCWQYNVLRGDVAESYPLYSVHQDGMAPMALLLLDQVSPGNYRSAVDLGIEWLRGHNELNCEMVDYSKQVIWRAIRRRGSQYFNVALLQNSMLSILGIKSNRKIPTGFSLLKECRPYHLGWVLLAWSK